MHRLLLLASLIVFAVLPAESRAQAGSTRAPMLASVDTNLFRGLAYRLVGPSRGGRVTTVTGVPSQPRTFYMGVASGGVFKTTDGGENWLPITDGKLPLGSTGSIAVADSDPNVVYLGTGSDGVRSNVSTGRGVYRSNDAGNTWQFIGLYNVGQIGAVRIHPTDPNTAWVAANGDIFKPTPDRGVYKTTDGGRNWKKVLFVSDSTGAMDVEVMPGNPNVLFAWMSRIERKPWTIISGSREGGFYKSTDGGENWTRHTTGLPGELIGKGNLAVTAANPNRIYALIEALPGGGLYRSDNGGTSWQLVNSTGGLVQRPFYYTTLGADPTNADVVYAGAESFYKSTDGGMSVQTMRTPHGDNHDIWVNPNDGRIMVQANDGGANVSFDGGATWSTQGNQPTGEFYGVWVDNEFPYNLYGAQQDNNTVIISSLAAGGQQGEDWRGGPGCETGPIIPHPRGTDVIYGSCKGQYEVRFEKSGTTRRYWIGAQSLYGNDARDLILRFQRVSPMATSPHDPDILYYGSQHVHRTRDYGKTWETISPDLTANPPCCQGASGEPITRDVTGEEFYSTLYAITESPHQRGVIWTGANDGPFHISRDNGATWTNITPKDLPTGGRVQWIEASPHRSGSAYFAVYRYLLGDYAPYIYRTDDYGQTWTRLTDGKNGIPADEPTRVVREDPDREGLLYAGTEFGMYISFDNGAHWQSFQLNLPNTPITDIKVFRKDLVLSTQGRGFWILDNLSSLQQIGMQQQQASQIHLYKPRDGYRTRETPGLYGPTIEYYLPSSPAGAVEIDILDAAGAVVNSYSSADAAGGAGGGRGGRGAGAGGGRGGAGGGRGGAGGAAAGRGAGAAGAGAAAAGAAGAGGAAAGRGGAGAAGGRGAGAGRAGGAAAAAAAGDPDDPDNAMAVGRAPAGRGGRGGGGGGGGNGSFTGLPVDRVTTNVGLNRFVWSVAHSSGMTAPAGTYQARLKVGANTFTTSFNVLVDPRLAAEGVTAADLVVLFDHNTRMNEMNTAVSRAVARVREAENRLRSATGAAAADSLAKVRAISEKLLTAPVRYGKPGLQAHISYLRGLTSSAEWHPGNQPLERYAVLKKELDAVIAEINQLLGPDRGGE